MSSTARPQSIDVMAMLGGRRGIVDATAPGILLVVVDTFAPLWWAIVAALVAAAVIGTLRLLRREPLRQAGAGVLGLAGAAALAAWTGDAKTYFLPGILINAFYACVATISLVVGRPALAYVATLLDSGYAHWREDLALRRAVTLATALWATVFGVRAIVQGYLYLHDEVHWLAPVKLGMGLPLWGVAAVVSLLLLEGKRREPASAVISEP